MGSLANGLAGVENFEGQLAVLESKLDSDRRNNFSSLGTEQGIANCLSELGRNDESLKRYRQIHKELVRNGESHFDTLSVANNILMDLLSLRKYSEAQDFAREQVDITRRALGAEHKLTLSFQEDLANAILRGDASSEEKRGALEMLEDTVRVMRRVLGNSHPEVRRAKDDLDWHRTNLRLPTA